MKLDRVIAVRTKKTIYRDGDRCIKVFNVPYSKAAIFNEASNHVRLEETGLTQKGDITFGIEVDRIYYCENTVVINDPVMDRKIRVSKSNSRTTIVWNPWIKKSIALPDFGDEEYHSMLCIEAANLLSDTITVPPYSEHSLSQTIGVE